MNQGDVISINSLVMSSVLVALALIFSYSQKLKLEKEIIIGALRAVIQLSIVGFVLEYIFGLDHPLAIIAMVLLMILNAAYNAAKRGEKVRHAFRISYLAIFTAALITLSVLVLTGAINFKAQQIIPVSGMIIGNAMVAIGLVYRQLANDFKHKRKEIETKLSLGAEVKEASLDIIRYAVKTGMQPTVDSAKTVGIVSLPGMMTGLIMAGTAPINAIKYQIMVSFMLMATTAIASFTAAFSAYRGFFNERKQLKHFD